MLALRKGNESKYYHDMAHHQRNSKHIPARAMDQFMVLGGLINDQA